MKSTIYLISLILFLHSIPSHAQRISLSPDRLWFKGKVIDENGEILPYTSIGIPGTQRGIISDVNGIFYIDAKPKETIYFIYAGKENVYRQLEEKDTAGIVIQMKPKIQRIEQSACVRKKSSIINPKLGISHYEGDVDSRFEIVYTNASFKGGDKTLDKYIDENLQYPQEAYNNGEEGEVLVQFDIDKTGTPTNANIIRSVSPTLDQEAIRFVLSMPKWEPAMQRGKPAKSTFVFPLSFHINIEQELIIESF